MGLLQQGDRTDPVHEHRKIIPGSRFFKKGVCGLQVPFFRPVPTRRQSGKGHVRLVDSSRPAGLFRPRHSFKKTDSRRPRLYRNGHRTLRLAGTLRAILSESDPPAPTGPYADRSPRRSRNGYPEERRYGFSGTSLSCGCDKNDFFFLRSLLGRPHSGQKRRPDSFVAEGQNTRRQQPIPATIEPPRNLP